MFGVNTLCKTVSNIEKNFLLDIPQGNI